MQPTEQTRLLASSSSKPILADAGQFSTVAAPSAPFTLFGPVHYESGYAYPLLVWLHGHGGDERHLLRVMPEISLRNYVGVSPRGTEQPADPSGISVFGWSQTDDGIAAAEQRVTECIEAAARRYNVDFNRIFVAGFDTGGTMAFRVALRRPERFAGVLSLGGHLPREGTPLRNLVASRRLPVFLAAGRASEVYPAEEVCENLRLLHSAGMAITLRQYPCGHELSSQMLGDVNRWIMEQIQAQRAVPDRLEA